VIPCDCMTGHLWDWCRQRFGANWANDCRVFGVERWRAARGQGSLGARGVFVPAGAGYARRCRRVRNCPCRHTVAGSSPPHLVVFSAIRKTPAISRWPPPTKPVDEFVL